MSTKLLVKFASALAGISRHKNPVTDLHKVSFLGFSRWVSTELNHNSDPAQVWSTLPDLPCTITDEEEIKNYFELNKRKYRSALPERPEYFEVVTVDEYNKKNHDFSANSPFVARVYNDEGAIGFVNLNPFIFGTDTRSDLLFDAYEWERRKGLIDYAVVRNQYEMLWSKRKLWPQKRSGRAAISHRGSSLFRDGGKAIGKRPTDHTIKIPDEKLRYAIRSILATRYREGNLQLYEEFNFQLNLPVDSKSLIIDTQADENHQFFNEDLDGINRIKYSTFFGATIKDFCKYTKLFMTLRALDMYDKLLKFDGIPYNNPNYDSYSDDFQVTYHFMEKLLKTPPKKDFKNAIVFKNDGQCQSSRRYVPSDASRHKFQERIKIIEEKKQQLWLTYRRQKFEKKRTY